MVHVGFEPFSDPSDGKVNIFFFFFLFFLTFFFRFAVYPSLSFLLALVPIPVCCVVFICMTFLKFMYCDMIVKSALGFVSQFLGSLSKILREKVEFYE